MGSPMIDRTCRRCGKVFQARRCRVKQGLGLYCSRPCAYAGQKSTTWTDLPDRFWANVDKSGECWIWTGLTTREGYGLAYLHGRHYRAHRVADELTNGPIPDGVVICHRCDNPACVHPEHLFRGTQADNLDDMRAKGRDRYAYGEDASNVKLTGQQVDAIREMRSSGKLHREIAEAFGVSTATVGRILAGRSWQHRPVKQAAEVAA